MSLLCLYTIVNEDSSLVVFQGKIKVNNKKKNNNEKLFKGPTSDNFSHLKTMCQQFTEVLVTDCDFAETGDLAGSLFLTLQLDSFCEHEPKNDKVQSSKEERGLGRESKTETQHSFLGWEHQKPACGSG